MIRIAESVARAAHYSGLSHPTRDRLPDSTKLRYTIDYKHTIIGKKEMRRRFLLILPAALILLLVVLYPSLQCRITRDQIKVSPVEGLVVPVTQGYVLGVRFNLTNLGSCELTADSIQFTLRDVTYRDGSHAAPGSIESESLAQAMAPGESVRFSYVFDAAFERKPIEVLVRIEVSLSGSGPIPVFDGQIDMHQ